MDDSSNNSNKNIKKKNNSDNGQEQPATSPAPRNQIKFREGDWVKVVGLKGDKQKWNGLIGTIVGMENGGCTVNHTLRDNADYFNNHLALSQKDGSEMHNPWKWNIDKDGDPRDSDALFFTKMKTKNLASHTSAERHNNEREIVDRSETLDGSNEGEWKTINRVKGKGSKSKAARPNRDLDYAIQSHLTTTYRVDYSDRYGPSDEHLILAINRCRNDIKSTMYWKNLMETEIFQGWSNNTKMKSAGTDDDSSSLIPLPPFDKLQTIICYGIGNFGGRNDIVTERQHYSNPMWQLALVLTIQESFIDSTGNCPTLMYYDPVTTEQESRILQSFGVEMITENEKGLRPIDTDSSNGRGQTTLFYMPHCGRMLYAHVLYANWEWNKLQHIVMFGNSLDEYIDNSYKPSVDSPEEVDDLDVLRGLQPFWKRQAMPKFSDDIRRLRHGDFECAFSQLNLLWFSSDKFSKELDVLPERPKLSYLLDL